MVDALADWPTHRRGIEGNSLEPPPPNPTNPFRSRIDAGFLCPSKCPYPFEGAFTNKPPTWLDRSYQGNAIAMPVAVERDQDGSLHTGVALIIRCVTSPSSRRAILAPVGTPSSKAATNARTPPSVLFSSRSSIGYY